MAIIGMDNETNRRAENPVVSCAAQTRVDGALVVGEPNDVAAWRPEDAGLVSHGGPPPTCL
jgi:hypothetical protein